MIEKDITTWEGFKTALTETITENTTYNIKNNLDASNDILTNNIECITTSDYEKVFNGNNYAINGITAYGKVTVFHTIQSKYYNFHFLNIKFTNFMVDSGIFTNLCNKQTGKLFENCFFNGVCDYFLDGLGKNSDKIAGFYKCSLNVRCTRLAVDGVTFDSCYINITPLQNINSFDSDAALLNSYVEGVIKNSFESSSPLTPKFYGNNVFNCKIIITNYSDSKTYKVNTRNGVTLVNKDKLLQSDGVTPIKNIATDDKVYFLTDEQMRNKNYIQQNTTFPLYG